ncbi:hypothetical protein Tco_0893276 [Tanacetum coccineum]|uniref:Transposase (Putative), gypsy type n=1 Tax=Tanacetum coccineum TaxID=301880 RepID=A0ABQ5CDQ5_9ASTR
MSFSKRQGNDAVCYTKPLDSLKSWNDRFFWVDAFGCPSSFSWNTSKSASKDPFPKVGERQRAKGEPKLLDTTMGRVVSLLPVAPARASRELEASVDRLFDEGGGGISETAEIVAEDAAPVQPRRQRKRKTVVSDAGEPSHPPKKLWEDHETSIGSSVAGKSKSALQRLLVGAVLNPKVGVAALPTLPFITSFVFVTPEREDGDQTDFMAGANLRTITAPPWFVISSDSSHHSYANIAEAEADSFTRPSVPLMTMTTTVTSTVDPTTTAKEKFAESSIFGGGSSSGAEHTVAFLALLVVTSLLAVSVLLLALTRIFRKCTYPQWSVTNGSFLDDGRTCREMVDEFAPPKFFASFCGMEHNELFTVFNVGAARQISLSAEVRMRAEFNIREKRILGAAVEEKNSLLKARDEEVASLKAQLLVKEAEAAEAIRLRAEVQTLTDRNTVLEREKSGLDVKVADLTATVRVREQEVADLDAVVTSVKVHNDNLSNQMHTLEVSSAGLQEKVTAYENFIGQLEKFQDNRMKDMNDNFDKLDIDLVELALHLEERFYPHLLTTISGPAIGKAVEKGMQEGLSAGITHGAAGRVLTDVNAYNLSVEADYLSTLQRLQSVNFSLITELKSNKDASIDTIMNLLRLEDSLAERLVLIESRPHVDQLMVPIHHSSDQRVIGASALSLSLDVSSSRVQRIKENIANHRSALRDVFVPLSEPFSATTLMGTEVISAPIDTASAPSTTLASVSTIVPISIEDYEVAGTDGQEAINESVPNDAIGGSVNPFSNVDDLELNVSQ